MTDMLQVKAKASTGEVRILAPEDVVLEFTTLTEPFITVTPLDDHEVDIPTVVVRSTDPEESRWRRIALSSEYEPDRVLWVDDARRHITVVGDPSPWRVQQLTRSVRHLLRWQAFTEGELLLHGGLVSAEGTGIAFVGGKRAGKTSSVLSALLHAGADFVSNDDLVVTEEERRLIGYGSPRTMNVRTDSLLALADSVPAVRGLFSAASHPTNSYKGRHNTVDAITSDSGERLPGSVWVRCAELAQVTGCRLAPRHRIDAVVFPRFDSSAAPQFTLLGREPAFRLLQENVEQQATKYDPFLAEWFPKTAEWRRRRLLDRILDEVPCYHLTQNMRRLGEATALMLETLNRKGQRKSPPSERDRIP